MTKSQIRMNKGIDMVMREVQYMGLHKKSPTIFSRQEKSDVI